MINSTIYGCFENSCVFSVVFPPKKTAKFIDEIAIFNEGAGSSLNMAISSLNMAFIFTKFDKEIAIFNEGRPFVEYGNFLIIEPGICFYQVRRRNRNVQRRPALR